MMTASSFQHFIEVDIQLSVENMIILSHDLNIQHSASYKCRTIDDPDANGHFEALRVLSLYSND